ncbi:CDP-glycerol glycerophosphotransferase family protein [Virgibacillus byunsanensis]|uniref:CDP-glycerol glycerophosphotransferase family protein n=1 Tax=Virgibacillus byunsanensis TaxID=570945 RepID=A0ABW3LFL4_9BACI
MKKLKLIPTLLVKYLLIISYSLFCLVFKINPNKVTFASYRSNTIKDNLAYVNEEIVRNYPSYNRCYIFKKFNSTLLGKVSYIIHMIKACFHLASSRYFIIDDYYFPIYVIKPRRGMDVIQLWHSAGALKKFGLSTVGKPFGPSHAYLNHVNIHGNYTKAYVSSSEVIPFFAEAFGMQKEKIYPLGIPRTDYFFDEGTIEELYLSFYEAYPELKDKKLLLYAPTFRGKSHYQESFKLPFDVKYMSANLKDEYALLIHLHPYMQSELEIDADGFTYLIHNTYTIQEFLALADILVTDYSTVFFDYSLLNKPMIFYPYDLKQYRRERDFYYSYEDIIPGPIVTNTELLVKVISESSFEKREINRFRDRFFDYQDGKASERIVEHIFEQ